MKITIEQIQSRLEQGLAKLRSAGLGALSDSLEPLIPPDGYRVRVAFLDENKRKIRKDASANHLSPASSEIRIYFEREALKQPAPVESAKQPTPVKAPVI